MTFLGSARSKEFDLKVLVCGGRAFVDADFIFTKLDEMHEVYRFTTIIEGDARGVDQIAGEWAQTRNIDLIKFPADWAGEGRHAALIRNERMLHEGKPDLVIGFPGGRGTWHTCSHAEKLGIPVVKVAQPLESQS
jgi:hypothetical protein